MKLPGPALWHVFADGAQVVRSDDGTVDTAHTLDAGYLTLPTGRLVVSDPFLDPWNEQFSTRVPPGSYLVLLSVIRGDTAADHGVVQERPAGLLAARRPAGLRG